MRYRQKVILSTLGLLLIALCCFTLFLGNASATEAANDEQQVSTSSESDGQAGKEGKIRFNFKMPTWFNFDKYKETFHKQYSSFMDELVRRKIYLGKALQVFVSNVQYKHFHSDSYLAVNPFSDQTPEELASWRMSREKLHLSNYYSGENSEILHDAHLELDEHKENENEEKGVDLLEEASELPLATPEDVQRELELIERLKDEPGFDEIAKELDESEEMFSSSTKDEDSSEVISIRVPSNNPNYVQAAEGQSLKVHQSASVPATIPQKFAGVVSSIPGANYVGNLVSGLASSLANKAGYGGGVNRLKEPDEAFVDLRETGCLLPVRNQRNCGACYAFAGIALYEYLYCMATGEQVAFSEQYMVDCGHRVNLAGCEGGPIDLTARFIDEFGLELQADRPYTGQQGSCPFSPHTPSSYMGYIRPSDTENLLLRLVNFDKYLNSREYAGKPAGRPILVGIYTPKNFDAYGGGVDPGIDCSAEEGGHAMLIVGHGREDGNEYYLLRNSHSQDWGIKGYYKLNKEALRRCAADPVGLVTFATFESSSSANSNSRYLLKKRQFGENQEMRKRQLESDSSSDPFKRRRIVPF